MNRFFLFLFLLFSFPAFSQPADNESNSELNIALGTGLLATSGFFWAYGEDIKMGEKTGPPTISGTIDMAKLSTLVLGTFFVGFGIDQWNNERKRMKLAPATSGVGFAIKF